jgi:hypothetical protein
MNIKQLKPSKSSRYTQGYVDPTTCKKLFEQVSNQRIIYRSSYELKFITWLENSDKVKRWGSECFYIPYLYKDGTTHKYYPDYFVEMVDGTKLVIEVKPYNQTQKPINDNCWAAKEYVKNVCKWKAAIEFCKNKGYIFKVLTEKTINQL